LNRKVRRRGGTCITIISDSREEIWPRQSISHLHPDYDQRIKVLEEQIKKLQNEVNDLKHKLETHDHPHTH
jgi:chaperonin cofactor prefoldin